VRLLKEIAVDYERVPRTVVLMSHHTDIPPELDTFAVPFELSLPDEEGLRAIFKDEVEAWQRRNLPRQVRGEREAYELLLRHLHGLTEPDVRRLIREALEGDGLIDASDLPRLIMQKHQIFSREGSLSFEFDSARFNDVAGLKSLKLWLDRRRGPFLDLASSAGLDVPKGIMLPGVQGCGKSLAAKAVAGAWCVPLMRLDFGSLFNKFLGETERNLRRVFDAAEEGGALLMFDEADALFGKRSEVKDSHDRYANIEVNYLLARMEDFRGVAILLDGFPLGLADGSFNSALVEPQVADRIEVYLGSASSLGSGEIVDRGVECGECLEQYVLICRQVELLLIELVLDEI